MSDPKFVHLNVHTEYSLVDGLVRVKPLMNTLFERKMPAIAITDHCNLFAAVKIQKAAFSAGIKPIFGTDIWVNDVPDSIENPGRVIFLIMNQAGYKRVTQWVSRAYLQGQATSRPCIDWAWMEETGTDGVIALSGFREGSVSKQCLGDNSVDIESLAQRWADLFPDRFYLEVCRIGQPKEEACIHALNELAKKLSLPLVATNAVRFMNRDAYEAHDVRVCINQGYTQDNPNRPRDYTEEQYLKSTEEMQALFSDLPGALQNSVEIAKRCNQVIPLGTYYLPDYPVPEGETIDSFIVRISHDGLEDRLDQLFADRKEEYRVQYQDRLQEELDIILQMGFPGYFLIVADFIQWGKNNGVPVGPGRGSGAGSLVAYVLKITDIDPIEYDLLFERFLNPERVSMPDFDVDFCMDGRDRVIEYVADKYGRGAVSQIITYGTMAAKAVVRDVGRVQGKAFGFVDRIAKLVPFEVGMTLTKALEQEEQLAELHKNDEEVKELLDMALKLEGITRNVGKHAGGVVIAPSNLTDFAPLYCDEEGQNLVTQFDKDDVESAGLVKFDFLGLRTLTIVDWALEIVNQQRHLVGESPIEISEISLVDKTSFEHLCRAETTAVFQLESRGMKDLIKKLQPTCFEDIVALVALFRPGPLQSGMVDDFINRKHGRAKVEYPHPSLAAILENTYGVIVYQEQVMQIAQILAGYTLGGADMLRRAMGKKKPEEMAKQRVLFLEGARKNNVPEAQAGEIFDTMEKFAAYGFNKSHSAAYALVSYQTLWLKTHFPAPFMAAVLTADMQNTDKVVILVEEAKRMGIKVLNPDVNAGAYRFSVNSDNHIVYGLGAIKGVGEGSINAIEAAREQYGEFNSLFDFVLNVGVKKLNKKTLEALIKSGALDSLAPNRATLWLNMARAIGMADRKLKDASMGMMDLFAGVETDDLVTPEYETIDEWPTRERLAGEKSVLGLYITGHPMDEYFSELVHWRCSTIGRLEPTAKGGESTIVGLVLNIRVMRNKKGSKMGFVTIEDRTGRIEVALFSDAYSQFEAEIIKDRVVVVRGEVSHDDYSGSIKMVARYIGGVGELRVRCGAVYRMRCDPDASAGGLLSFLKSQPESPGNRLPILVEYFSKSLKGTVALGEQWSVGAEDEMLLAIKERLGQEAVTIDYETTL